MKRPPTPSQNARSFMVRRRLGMVRAQRSSLSAQRVG